MLSHWKLALDPVRKKLVPALAASLEDSKWGPRDRRALIEFCREFSGEESKSADEIERRLLVQRFENSVADAKRKANLAAALVALRKGENAWPLLVHKPDPTLRSFLIERIGMSDVDPGILQERLAIEHDASIRRAIVLALGEIPYSHSANYESRLLDRYEHDPDPGTHSALRWTLMAMKRGAALHRIDEKYATGEIEGDRRWMVGKNGTTFAILEGPASRLMRHRRMGNRTLFFDSQ